MSTDPTIATLIRIRHFRNELDGLLMKRNLIPETWPDEISHPTDSFLYPLTSYLRHRSYYYIINLITGINEDRWDIAFLANLCDLLQTDDGGE